ncbi:MAG TPA: GAF domain-containing protein [Coleofasciculaceae cyanobacterium]
MTKQFYSAFPVKQHPFHNAATPGRRTKSLVLALCLSLIPALGIGVISSHVVSQAVTKQIAQTPSSGTLISSTLQKELLLKLTLLSGVTALLASAIAAWFTHRLSFRSSTPQYSPKTLLFGDISSQTQPPDLDYLYKRAVDGAREILQADRVIIYTFDTSWNGTITAESVAPGFVESLGNQIVDTCMRDTKGGLYKHGRVFVSNDITQTPLSDCHRKLLESYQVKAKMVVPILQDEQLLGLMIAHQCDQPRFWQANEIDFFVQLASLIALRLSDINFLQHREKAGQARLFSSIALRIRQCHSPEDVFNTATAEIRQILNLDRVLICRLSPILQDGRVVAESVASGWPKMLGLPMTALGIAEHHLEKFKNGHTHPINILSDQNYSDINVIHQYKIQASLVTPIRLGEHLQGLIIAHQCSTTRNWEEYTIDLFEELAVQVSFALEQATLLKSVTTEAKCTQVLADFISCIRQSFNSKDILSTPLEEIRNTLEIDRLLLYRFYPGGRSGEIMSQAIASDCLPVQQDKINKLFQKEDFQGYTTGNIWVAHDVFQDDLTPSHSNLLESLHIKASIVAPILVGDQLVGLLCAHQCYETRIWQQSEFYLLKQLAVQIGFALDQAKLIEQLNVVSVQQQQQSEALRSQLISLVKDVEQVVKGDLTVRADVTEGEIGTVADFLNAVIENLRGIVTRVKLATTQVNASLGENEQAIRQLADAAFKQTEETTRILESVEQMTQSIQEVANSANHAAAVTRTASATAQVGEKAMERTVQKILNLQETVAETAKKVKRLSESSQEISKVVSLINQIAVQTNLLALNAGIEASRAGEEGQGFAVVAKEVGQLAARSAAATRQIEQIVETIQIESTQAVEAMERGTTEVVEGTHLVEETKQSLGQILDVSRQIDQLVQSISGATVSQVEASNVVTELIKEMVIVSEQTSKSSHQISSSLQQTVEVAQELQSSMEVFKVDETNTPQP